MLTQRPSSGVGPISGRWSGVIVYWPATIRGARRARPAQTARQKGATRAAATGLAGSRSGRAKAGSTGTTSAGGVGGVSGSVCSRNAPPSAGRQWVPVSSSIVIGAPGGTGGRSGRIAFCRRTVVIGSATPAAAASRPERGPAAITAASVAIGPAVVSTPASRPPATRKPVTPQPVMIGTSDPAASPSVSATGSRNPSPARKRAPSTAGPTKGKRRRASSPSRISTSSSPQARCRATRRRWRPTPSSVVVSQR